jgi:ParB-like chromosome segregation protein Spo0J
MPKTNPIIKAKQLKKRLNKASTRDAAKRLGLSHSSIAQTLALLKLSVAVQRLLQDGKISKTHAKLLCPLPPDKQLLYANLAVSQKLSVRGLELAIRSNQPRNISPDVSRLEQQISEYLATPVKFDEKRMTITIKYHNLEGLYGILEKIGCSADNEI